MSTTQQLPDRLLESNEIAYLATWTTVKVEKDEHTLIDAVQELMDSADEAWEVEIDIISGQLVIEAEREDFHQNGATARVIALDHPKEAGWQVMGVGASRDCWESRYESGLIAADVLAELTHIFEMRRTMQHHHAHQSRLIKLYFQVEDQLLEAQSERTLENGGVR